MQGQSEPAPKMLVLIASTSAYAHRICDNRKRSKQSTNADQKSLETVFYSSDLLSTFVDRINIFDCRLSGVVWKFR